MSEADRVAIAAAASTVDGIDVKPWFRQTTATGAGMVRLDRRERDGSGLAYFTNVWQVLVILPQDTAAAEKYLEQKLDPIIDALAAELVVTRAAPVDLALESGTKLPCVVIEGTREN